MKFCVCAFLLLQLYCRRQIAWAIYSQFYAFSSVCKTKNEIWLIEASILINPIQFR